MQTYDANKTPNRNEWLALDKTKQLTLIRDYHQNESMDDRALTSHCGMHAAVETQIAQNTPGVRDALGRLRKQGIDRHNAVHAIGLILLQHMRQVALNPSSDKDLDEMFQTKLAELGEP